MSERWDAIVVGAGPAGSALAIQLAQAGAGVLLVDRARFPRDKLCGEFLSPECWPILERLGAGDALRTCAFQPIRRMRLWLGDRPCVEAAMPDRPAIGLSRAALDQILVRRAESVGVTVAESTQTVRLLRHDRGVVGVRTRTGGGTAAPEDNFAKVVIAADGRGSLVVRESGRTLMRRRSTPETVCAVKRHYRTRAALDPGDCIELHSFSGGYAGTCRVESGLVNLCTLLPVTLIRQTRGNIDLALGRAFANSRVGRLLDESEPIGEWKTVPDVCLEHSRPTWSGVLYVGDAMGTVDPLGGEGMAMALQGAELAARYVAQAVERRAGCDRSLQQSYERAWSGRFAQRIRFCRWFSWLLARPKLLGRLLAPSIEGAWTESLLRLAFRATRDRPSLSMFQWKNSVGEKV